MQCALRADSRGHVQLTALRGMGLCGRRELWQERASAGWSRRPSGRCPRRCCSMPRSSTGTRSPCALPRGPLGATPCPVGPADPTGHRAADPPGARHPHIRRCRTPRRDGRPRRPVRALPAADRRASRSAGGHPHAGLPALATASAPSPPCGTDQQLPGSAAPAPGSGQKPFTRNNRLHLSVLSQLQGTVRQKTASSQGRRDRPRAQRAARSQARAYPAPPPPTEERSTPCPRARPPPLS